MDVVCIDNAVEAHLLAADRLTSGSPVFGKAYFITHGEPITVGDMIDFIVEAAGLPPITRTISPRVAWAVGGFQEGAHRVFEIMKEPK